MSYTKESSQGDGTIPSMGRRERERAYKQRNSDGKNTFEGERTFAPPAFDLEEYPLPMTDAQRVADAAQEDDEGADLTDRGTTIVHEHVYDDATDIDWTPDP